MRTANGWELKLPSGRLYRFPEDDLKALDGDDKHFANAFIASHWQISEGPPAAHRLYEIFFYELLDQPRTYIGSTSSSLHSRIDSHCNNPSNPKMAHLIWGAQRFRATTIGRFDTRHEVNEAERAAISELGPAALNVEFNQASTGYEGFPHDHWIIQFFNNRKARKRYFRALGRDHHLTYDTIYPSEQQEIFS